MIGVRTILCPVDFTPLSRSNLRLGVEMCKRIGARLVLHHNQGERPPGYLSVTWMWSEDREAGAEKESAQVPGRLENLFSEIPPEVEYEARVTRGPLDAVLLYLAEELPADLIVIGTHGWSNAEHRSITERLIIQAPCPVITIGEDYDAPAVFDAADSRSPAERRFLVPVDLSPQGDRVLDFVFELASAMPHGIEILHVVKPGNGAGPAAEARRRLEAVVPDSLRERVSVVVESGRPVHRILEAATRADPLCIVMGAHGKSLLKRYLFGTTTLEILHGSPCPVWFIPDAASSRRSNARMTRLEED